MSNPFAHKSGEEIAAMWQTRALHASSGKMQHVLFRAMANEYTGVTSKSWVLLLSIIIPNFNPDQPFLDGYAKIMQSGRVVSEVFYRGDKRTQIIYENKDQFISDMRRLADRLKLSDLDRTEMFALLGRWIVADYRVGLNGEKLAS